VCYLEKEMAGFKVLRTVAILSMMIATQAQAQAHGIKGREATAPPWIAACSPSVCGEPMRVYGAHGGHDGKKNALSPGLDASHRNGRDKTQDNWQDNLILG
jgi:hypothetical protein